MARIFNTYGPRMHPNDGRVVSNFIVQALQGEPITIYGDGSQTRSFCYVDDLIDGLMRLMAPGRIHRARQSRQSRGVHHFGARDDHRRVTGSTSEIVTEELPKDDPERRRPDITLARSDLGWSPQVPLAEGIAKTIDYFDDLLRSTSKSVN